MVAKAAQHGMHYPKNVKGTSPMIFGWLRRLLGGKQTTPPTEREVKGIEKDRASLQEKRSRLLYEAMELDDQIQGLYTRFKKTENDVMKKELMRDLTIKRAEY